VPVKQNETLIKASQSLLPHYTPVSFVAQQKGVINRRKRRAATMTMSWAKKHSIALGPRMQMHIKCELSQRWVRS